MPAEVDSFTVSIGGCPQFVKRYKGSGSPTASVIALHGFTGSGRDWEPVIAASPTSFEWVCPDLPGHGQSLQGPFIDYYRVERGLALIHALRKACSGKRILLLGYSMGGRVALHYLRHHHLPALLIGASPGIDNPEQRRERQRIDEQRIGPTTTIEAFCEEWERLPIIKPQLSLPQPLCSQIATRRRANNIKGLRHALIALSPGRIPSLWADLPQWPAFCSAFGEMDTAYAAISEKMSRLNPRIRSTSIPQASHAAHLDNPQAVAALVTELITNLH